MERNPNHPVTRAVREEWHKVAALLMFKFGVTDVTITLADIENWTKFDRMNIVLHEHRDSLEVRLVTDAEATQLAAKAGGLPI